MLTRKIKQSGEKEGFGAGGSGGDTCSFRQKGQSTRVASGIESISVYLI